MSVHGRESIKGPNIALDVYKNPFGLKSQAYAYAAPENRHSNCREAIVFLCHGNNCVYKWTAEIWGLKEMRGQIGNDSWRSEFVKGRISLGLGKIQFSVVTQKSPTSTVCYHFKSRNVFCFARICASSFQEHLLVCLLLTNECEREAVVGKLSASLWKEHRYRQHMAALSTELHLSNFINMDSQDRSHGIYCRKQWAGT